MPPERVPWRVNFLKVGAQILEDTDVTEGGPLFHKPRRRAVFHTSPERGTSAGTRILRTLDYGRGLLVRRWGAA